MERYRNVGFGTIGMFDGRKANEFKSVSMSKTSFQRPVA